MIKEGDLIFTYTGSIFSKLVNIVQRGRFGDKSPSHVAVVTNIYSSDIILIEASLRGVRTINLDHYEKAKTWVKRIKDPKDVQKGLIHINRWIGEPYDYVQLGGMLARTFFRLFGKRVYQKSKTIRNFLDSRQKFICSELGGKFVKESTGKEPWHCDMSQLTPWDLFRSDLLEEGL